MFVDVDLVIGLLAAQLRVSPSEVGVTRRFVEDLGASEVEIANVLLALEQQFDLRIDNDDAVGLRCLSEVLQYLDGRLMHRGE